MKMKKVLSLVMACVMALSLAATAFASGTTADVTDPSKTTNVKVTGSTLMPTIKLTVPTSAAVVLNPYGMKLKSDLSDFDSSGTEQDKVVSAISNIVNLSDVGIKVGVTATGTVTAGVTFAKASVANVENKDKQVYVALEMITADDTSSAKADFTEDAVGTNKVVLSTTATALKTPIALAASDDNTDPGAGGVLAFRFTGDVSKTPTTPWSNKDVVGATLAFTFTPVDAA